ncbi:MAG: hypothetical protein GC136_01055 [Alphaproteobacteria bacterium]|nr:hypothetical protein [Alphaproteobacteria bacterium]
MKQYLDSNGDSGVAAYDVGADFIHVRFKDGWIYEYTSSSVGAHSLDAMKSLARSGDGLNSFINKQVRKKYARKWR